MTSVKEAWARLGIAATDDRREIKRAYSRALKAIDPEADPSAFIALREAYDVALQWGTQTPYWEDEAFPELLEVEGESGAEPAEVEPAEEEWWERWRPEPPAQEDDGLREACLELDRLLFQDPPPPPALIAQAGRAVMSDPGLAKVDYLTETELWLAEAISASSPRSDPLIEPAIARFGWAQAGRDWRRHYRVAAVLDRRDDLIFLARCRTPSHVHWEAVDALTKPPPQRLRLAQLGLAGDVAKFLDVVAKEHPTLERDLDPDSLDWWRTYLHGRHLPPNFALWMLAAPAAVTFGAAFAITSRGWPLWLLLAVFPLTMLATWGALLGKAELDARARERRSQAWAGETEPVAGIERLAMVALLLPPLAALLPNGTLWASLSLTASLGLAAAGLRRGWVESDRGASARARTFLPTVATIIAATMLTLGSAEEAVKLCPPLIAMCWIGARLFAAMQIRSQAWSQAAWRAVLAGSLLSLGAVAIALVAALSAEPVPLWALMLVPSAIVGGHLAAAGSEVDVHGLEWPLRVVAVLVYFGIAFLGEDQFWLRAVPAVSAYGLLYAGSRVGVVLFIETVRSKHGNAPDE